MMRPVNSLICDYDENEVFSDILSLILPGLAVSELSAVLSRTPVPHIDIFG
jgi:hypothetical protein